MSTFSDFIEMVLNKGIKIVPMDEASKILISIKKLTENINFACDFKNGVCRQVRAVPDLFINGCCCGDCKNKIGYLHTIYFENLKEYVSKWDYKDGFFEVGKGCRLSIELRSGMCLGQRCNYERWTPFENEFLNLLQKL